MSNNPYRAPETELSKGSAAPADSSSWIGRVIGLGLILVGVPLLLIAIARLLTGCARVLNQPFSAEDLGRATPIGPLVLAAFAVWLMRFGSRSYSGKVHSLGPPSFLFWTGHGYVVPLIVIGSSLVTQLTINAVLGEGTYHAAKWPGAVTAILIAASCFSIGARMERAGARGSSKHRPTHTFLWMQLRSASIVTGLFIFVITLFGGR